MFDQATRAASHPQPAVSEAGDDKSHDDVITVPRDRDCDDHTSPLVEEIEQRIEALDDALARVTPLVVERQRLLEARAQILGLPLPRPAAPPPRRVTREDVESVLRSHPGSRAGQIARMLDAGQPAISAHLYRGKGSRFQSSGGRWFVMEAE